MLKSYVIESDGEVAYDFCYASNYENVMQVEAFDKYNNKGRNRKGYFYSLGINYKINLWG